MIIICGKKMKVYLEDIYISAKTTTP